MNAIMVSVDYCDILQVTLPYNRHHFNKVLVVTSLADYNNVLAICEPLQVDVYATDVFYQNGAKFNKWAAMEQGLDVLGREGWMCVMDADVLWPSQLPTGWMESLQLGKLYTPLRRFYPNIPTSAPSEATWEQYPLTRYIVEWGGYTQIFHASDPVLEDRPWYQTNWRHAGGGDSFFQMRWSQKNKVRPPWEVLHLGEHGVNWHGRTVRMADGSLPSDYTQHKQDMDKMYQHRRANRSRGYDNPIEKIL